MIKYTWGCCFETKGNRFVRTEKNGFTPIRKVREYEIEVYDADGGMTVINGKEYHIKKGNVLVVFPGDQRQSKPDFKCYSLKFLCDDVEFTGKLKEIAGMNQCEIHEQLIEDIKSIYPLTNEINKEIVTDAKIRTIVAALYENITLKKRKFSSI